MLAEELDLQILTYACASVIFLCALYAITYVVNASLSRKRIVADV